MGEPTEARAASVISIGRIHGLGLNDPGLFRMSNELVGWKSKLTGKVSQWKSDVVTEAVWCQTAPDFYQLRLGTTDGPLLFEGFSQRHMEQVAHHIETYYRVSCKSEQMPLRGVHWGTYSCNDGRFAVQIDQNNVLDLGSNDITQVSIAGKSEVSLNFSDENTNLDGNFLTEIHFVFPNTDNAEENPATLVRQQLSGMAHIEPTTNAIAIVPDLNLLVPRGRHDAHFLGDACELHGKSYDFTLVYGNIKRLMLVPRPNSSLSTLVVALTKPIVQGQTNYRFVSFQLDNTIELNIDLENSHANVEKHDLPKAISGNASQAISTLFSKLTEQPVKTPQSTYRTASGVSGITCHYKASTGHLYILDDAFLFGTKPIIHIKFTDIVAIECSRTPGATTRFFAISVALRSGREEEFTSIAHCEHTNLMKTLETLNLKIRSSTDANRHSTARIDQRQNDSGENRNDNDDEEDEEDEEEYQDSGTDGSSSDAPSAAPAEKDQLSNESPESHDSPDEA